MKAKKAISHRGITVYIRKVDAVKNGVTYSGWEILDYSGGKRRRHQRTTLDEAKTKAREVCECLASNKREVLEWSDEQRFSIQRALKLVEPTGTTIDRAATIFAESTKIIPAEEIVAACRAWNDERPNRRLTPKTIDEAVPEFLERRADKVSDRRYRTDRCYLGIFQKRFAGRLLHEITKLEIKDWAATKGWKPKTKNDAIGLVRMFYADALERNYGVENPAMIKRESVGHTDIEIFTPGQVRRIMEAIEDRLKPIFAILFFSGLRKEEASRLTVAQVRDGLKSGAIFVNGSIAKTNRNRSVTVSDNLKAWLTQYLPLDGTLLPIDWQCIDRIDQLGQYAQRMSGVRWVYNGPRHSFGTYHLRLRGDTAETVRQMGNSLVQLDQHYSSRADSVTREIAQEYFAILPTPCGDVVRMETVKAA